MKFVRESLLEFERGLDPKSAMGIGIKDKIVKDLEKFGLTHDQYEILPDLTIHMTKITQGKTDWIKLVELKYKSPAQYEFINKFKRKEKKSTHKIDIESAIDKALDDGISKKDIEKLLQEWGDKTTANDGHLYLLKRTRNKNEKEYDKENNVYAFIGFTDKVPVTIKGEKYYKDKLGTETILKVDPFDMNAHRTLSMMKIRARVQYPNEKYISSAFQIF